MAEYGLLATLELDPEYGIMRPRKEEEVMPLYNEEHGHKDALRSVGTWHEFSRQKLSHEPLTTTSQWIKFLENLRQTS